MMRAAHRMILLLAGSLLVAILMTVFAFQNGGPVVVRFFRAEFHVSLGLALMLSAATGMVAGLLACAAALVRMSLQPGRPPKITDRST